MSEPRIGGQAVIEGVMMRGPEATSIAVRAPSGEIIVRRQDAPHRVYTSRFWRLPLLRGVFVLWDSLTLGIGALMFSAGVAAEEEGQGELGRAALWTTLALSLTLSVGLFVVTPAVLADLVAPYLPSILVRNLLEGILRLLLFLGYLYVIGLSQDIRRVFGYHGAEHMTIHAWEDGSELEVATVRGYSTAHPRCGTSFLLVVLVVFIIVFALFESPSLPLRIVSRVVLIPVIVGIAYEVIRLSLRFRDLPLFSALLWPGLALQRLTTRPPEDGMIEVAIAALHPLLPKTAEDGASR